MKATHRTVIITGAKRPGLGPGMAPPRSDILSCALTTNVSSPGDVVYSASSQ